MFRFVPGLKIKIEPHGSRPVFKHSSTCALMAMMKGRIVAIFQRIVDAMEKDPSIQMDLLSVMRDMLHVDGRSLVSDVALPRADALTPEDDTRLIEKIRNVIETINRKIWIKGDLVSGVSRDDAVKNRIASEIYNECISTGIGPRISDELWTVLTRQQESKASTSANIIRRDILIRALRLRPK